MVIVWKSQHSEEQKKLLQFIHAGLTHIYICDLFQTILNKHVNMIMYYFVQINVNYLDIECKFDNTSIHMVVLLH